MSRKFPDIEDISIEEIYEWQERGLSSEVLPENIANYFDAMDKVRGMKLRFDKWGSKDAIIDYLVNVEGFSRYLAMKLHDQAVEFFYCETQVSKEAWYNLLLDKMEKNLHFAILRSKDTSDAAKIQKMIEQMANIIKDMFPDKDHEDDGFRRPVKLYTMSAEEAGLPSVDRKALNAMIDNYPEIPEVVKTKIKEEALVLPLKIFADTDPREQ